MDQNDKLAELIADALEDLEQLAELLQVSSTNLLRIAGDLRDGLRDKAEPDSPIDIISVLPWHKRPRWPFPFRPRELSAIKYITIHHSGATPREKTSIWNWSQFHTEHKGWSRLGYHFCIGPLKLGGDIGLYQANDLEQVAWHDTRNYDTVGVVIAGDLRSGKDGRPTAEQIDLFGRLMTWLLPQLPALEKIVPHSHWQHTACPGDIDLWGRDLIDAAAHHGADIEDLVSLQRTRLVARVLAMQQPEGTPPVELYEGV